MLLLSLISKATRGVRTAATAVFLSEFLPFAIQWATARLTEFMPVALMLAAVLALVRKDRPSLSHIFLSFH